MFKIRFFVLLTLVVLLIFPVVAQEDEAPVLSVGGFGGSMRSGTSSDYDVLSSLANVDLPILGFNEDTNYYLVASDGEIGWVNGFLPDAYGNLELVPLLTYESLAEIPQLELEDSVVLYQLPDAESDVIAEIENAFLYLLAIDETESYLLVVHEGLSGWLSVEAVADSDLDFSELAIIGGEASIEACMISTGQASTVRVRVGYGENRTSVTFLEANTEFEVIGQNTDDNGATWYALDKEDSAPGKSIVGDVAWVLATEVDTTGDCDALSIVEAEHIRFIVPTTSSDETGNSDAGTSVFVSSVVVWVDTGITLSSGQSYSITGTGLANLCGTGNNPNCVDDPEVNREIGPAGNTLWETCEGQYDPCQLMPGTYGALVGRVGTGSAFYVGTGGNFTAGSNGNLFLGFNDHKFWDNTGAFTATITVR